MKEIKKKMAGLLFAVSNPNSSMDSAMFKVEQILDVEIGRERGEKCECIYLFKSPAVNCDKCKGTGTIRSPVTIRDAIEEYLKWK